MTPKETRRYKKRTLNDWPQGLELDMETKGPAIQSATTYSNDPGFTTFGNNEIHMCSLRATAHLGLGVIYLCQLRTGSFV